VGATTLGARLAWFEEKLSRSAFNSGPVWADGTSVVNGMTSLRRGFFASALALLALLGTALPVPAAPDHGGESTVGALAEEYNLARYRLAQATTALERTEARIGEARRHAERLRALARARAAALYQRASGSSPTILAVDSVSELSRRTAYVEAADAPDQELFEELEASLDRLQAERAAQATARDQLQEEAAAADAARERIEAAARAASTNGASEGSGGDGAGPVGTPKVLRGTPATPMQAPTAPPTTTTPAPRAPGVPAPPVPPAPTTSPTTPSTTTPPAPAPAPPPVSGAAATAVAFARAQLGKPYVFATAGPNSYDCSGLTMAAWRAAGVRMPHYSGAQAAMFPKVAWGQLQPGDIVVFYPDLHHVGIYIGGGQMIHAPQTGDVVKIAPAWRTTFQYGVRPR